MDYQNVRLYCRALHGPETMLKGQHFSTLTYDEMECLLSYLYLVLVEIACETFFAVLLPCEVQLKGSQICGFV